MRRRQRIRNRSWTFLKAAILGTTAASLVILAAEGIFGKPVYTSIAGGQEGYLENRRALCAGVSHENGALLQSGAPPSSIE